MKIIKLDLKDYNFNSPATGEPILIENEPVNDDEKSLIAYWIDEYIDEPMIKDNILREAWGKFNKNKQLKANYQEWDFLEEFLSDYSHPSWVVYKLCGPDRFSYTVWKVIDMSVTT